LARIDVSIMSKLLSDSRRGVSDLFDGGQKLFAGDTEVFHPPVNLMLPTHVDVKPIFQTRFQ